MTPLRQRMLEEMAIRNLAENTQSSYLQQIVCYARGIFNGHRKNSVWKRFEPIRSI